MSVGPSQNDIMEYLRLRLEEDETPEAMDESLEAEILEKFLRGCQKCTLGECY